MANLEIKNVSKVFRMGKVRALEKVELTIRPGLFGLLGPNGAGKTTLMRILATVLSADSGDIQFGEIRWNKPLTVAGQLGYLPQDFNVYKYLTVREALRDIALLKGVGNREIPAQVEKALERAHLTEFAGRRIGQLSGGMLRRVGIAQALVGEPDLLIVDEPSAGLDPTERIHLRKMLRDYDNGERIILISSHIVEDIESLCDQVAIMDHGQILAQGSMESVRDRAQGQVAEKVVSREEYDILEKDHTIISFRPEGAGRVLVRYLLAEGDEQTGLVAPSLEDSYTFVVGGGRK